MDHPALLYGSQEEFLAYMLPYIRAGLETEEVVFVASRGDNVEALQDAVGPAGGAARWADTDEWHPHPASRLRAFHEFITDGLEAGAGSFRLAGEPVWPEGPQEFVREWQRYESVLNAVLAPFPVSLVCPYDSARLDPGIVEVARRTHPRVSHDSAEEVSRSFEPPQAFLERWNPDLSPPPETAAVMTDVRDLAGARHFVRDEALRLGLSRERAVDLSLAANEVLTNALTHGGGPVTVRTWSEDGRLICQIEDRGSGIPDPLAGYRPPRPLAQSGHGLWLARQLVDLLQIVPRFGGTTMRLHEFIR